MSAFKGVKQTCRLGQGMSANDPKRRTEITQCAPGVLLWMSPASPDAIHYVSGLPPRACSIRVLIWTHARCRPSCRRRDDRDVLLSTLVLTAATSAVEGEPYIDGK